MSESVRALLIWALVLGCQLGCQREPTPEPSGPVVEPPPAAPDYAGHFCVGAGAFDELRAVVAGPAGSALPENAAAFLASQLGITSGLDALASDSRLCGLAIDDEMIVAVQVRRGTPNMADVSRFGDVAVFGEEQARRDAAEYLARVVFEEEQSAPVSFHARDGVIAQRRTWMDQTLGELRESGRSAIAAERERHQEPPAFGDPDVALDLIVRRIRRQLEYLPDVGEVNGIIAAENGGLLVEARSTIREGSPLAQTLASQSQSPAGIGALPRGTALAYMRASEGDTRLSADLIEIAGARVTGEEADRVRQAADAMSPPFTLALGAQAVPWLEYRGVVPDALTLDVVLAGPYVRELVGGLFGCERVRAAWPAAGDRPGARCQRPPLTVESTSILLGARDASVLSESPDVARLTNENTPVLGAIYLDPLRVPMALSLFALVDRPEAREEPPSPVLLTWQAQDGQLTVRVKFAPRAISQLVVIGATLDDDGD